MNTLRDFNSFTSSLPEQGSLMPVLFMGHGSPMNGIETNEFTQNWRQLAQTIPTPSAVLVISAHWLSKGTRVTAMDFPKTIHDFGGFPPELFAVQYPAPGSPQLAQETARIIQSIHVEEDHDWGLDHGAWSVVKQMYPAANIPVLQLSIDYTQPPQYHYELARELTALRRKGVLIMGSGNMVHNLRMVAWEMMEGGGYDWALEMNERFKDCIQRGDHASLIHYELLGSDARLAIPTPEHYLPLLYTLGLQQPGEAVNLFNDKAIGGSLTMTSVKIG
ncbi:4,5-DOPA dioxygenase extradiol [Chitinophaga costaii]|nr:4,5-DOPA dioxygenase extradiol [Chitinophaga costaii]PUZ30531.1 4,5-DOPA dioxygenase extradiol [Chitinophaga costaii]